MATATPISQEILFQGLKGVRQGYRWLDGFGKPTTPGPVVPTPIAGDGWKNQQPYNPQSPLLPTPYQFGATQAIPQTNTTVSNYAGYSNPFIAQETAVNPYNADGTTKTNDYIKRAIATTKAPVVDRTGIVPTGIENVDYSSLQGMDITQLQDWINQKQVVGGIQSKEDQLMLMKAGQLLKQKEFDKMYPQQDPYQAAIQEAQRRKELADRQWNSEKIKTLDKQETALQEQQGEAMKAENAAYEKVKEEVMTSFANRGMASSSEATNKIQELATNLGKNIEIIDSIRVAEMAKYKAELDGMTPQEVASRDKYIDDLKGQSNSYQTNMINDLNAMNSSVSWDAKIENILAVSKQLEASQVVPLDEAEDAMAKNYATMLLDGKGGINQEILKMIPQELQGTVMKYAAEGMKDNQSKEFEYMKGDKGIWSIDEDTGIPVFTPEPGQGGGDTGYGSGYMPGADTDLTSERGKTIKNTGNVGKDLNNPGNLTKGGVGDQYAIGSVRVTGKDGVTRSFLVFPTLEAGRQASYDDLKAKMTGNSNYVKTTDTLAKLLDVWVGGAGAPAGYKNAVATATGYNMNQQVTTLNFENLLGGIQKAEGTSGDKGHDYTSLGEVDESLAQVGDYIKSQMQLGGASMSNEDRELMYANIDSYVKTGNKEMLKQKLREQVLSGKEISEDFYASKKIASSIRLVRDLLAEYERTGNSTGFLTDLAERGANYLGMTTNDFLAQANGSLGMLVADYIRAISGAQASEAETSRLTSVLPKIKNISQLNTALMDQIEKNATSKIRSQLEAKYRFAPEFVRFAFDDVYGEGTATYGFAGEEAMGNDTQTTEDIFNKYFQ